MTGLAPGPQEEAEGRTEHNSKHFVGGGTGLMGWVGAAVPTSERRC